ncbi:MAG: hypothetical protein HZC06_10845, partial [Methylocystis sp.]|nr:hypothetical protein [Methylocystis sp.]
TRKTLQRSATGGAIFLSPVEEMRRRHAKIRIPHLEAGWVLESNADMRRPIEMFGGKVDKIHRIYEKRLTVGDGGGAMRMRDGVTATQLQDATS